MTLSRIAGLAALAAFLLLPREAPAPIQLESEPPAPSLPAPARIATVELGRVEVRAQGDTAVAVVLRVGARTASGADVVDFGRTSVTVFQDGERLAGDALTVAPREDGASGFSVEFGASADGQTHEIRVELDQAASTTSVTYPASPSSLPNWLVPASGVAGALILGALVLWLRRRSIGHLTCVSGPRSGESTPLRPGTVRIGSFSENDLVLESAQVSRFHAQITVHGRQAEIRDLHSTNGTFVNGAPVEQAFLSPGDKIRIGDVELFFDR